MKKISAIIAALAIVALFVVGCQKPASAPATKSAVTSTATATAPAVPAAPAKKK